MKRIYKTSNLINRLRKVLDTHPVNITIQPKKPAQPEPTIRLLSTERTKLANHEYELLGKRLAKKLAASGIVHRLLPAKKCIMRTKPKCGFMDKIGEIIDADFNTIPISKTSKFFNSAS